MAALSSFFPIFRMTFWISSILLVQSQAFGDIAHFARFEKNAQGKFLLLYRGETNFNLGGQPVREISRPQTIVENEDRPSQQLVEIYAASRALLDKTLADRGLPTKSAHPLETYADEVQTLVSNGPVNNRINLVFMGDGYTQSEREKFLSDIQRLVSGLFGDATFHSYLPLFNVHLVFRPSKVSGIGRNDTPRDTAYQLYREGNTLRAILPGNPRAIRSSCAQAPACDYPIVIANDPFYGGLGGEFAISTSSITSGLVVLRHELGHSLGEVGEEYDGGGYFGANFSSSASAPGWEAWLSEKPAQAEPAVSLHIAWPWHQLAEGPYRASWRSRAENRSYQMVFSASGIETLEGFNVRLDTKQWVLDNPKTIDRTFFRQENHTEGFGAGPHELVFSTSGDKSNNKDLWLSNLAIFEFGPGFHFDSDFVGSYPLFSRSGSVTGYRPTFEKCLMRNMLSERFCPVCLENLWLKFFRRISLIDDVKVERTGTNVMITLNTPRLAQFRQDPNNDGSRIEIRWYRSGIEQPQWRDQDHFQIASTDFNGEWKVLVQLLSPEVRSDSEHLLTAQKSFGNR